LIKAFALMMVVLACGWMIALLHKSDSRTQQGLSASKNEVPEALEVKEEPFTLPGSNTVKKSRENLSFNPGNFTGSHAVPSYQLSDRKPLIRVEDNQLTVRIHNQRLDWVVKQISQRSGVPIFKDERIGNRLLSIELEGSSLEEGLREILSGYDMFIFYGGEHMTPRAVWVYPEGHGKEILPVPPELWASTAEMEQKLADPDPEERARSVEAMVQRREPHSLDAVFQALEDGDALVRNRALDAAVNSRLELPEDTLIRLVQFDPAPEVRFLALAGLAARLGLHSDQDSEGTTSEVRAISEQALNDPSQHVRWQAKQILDTLDGALSVSEPEQPQQGEPQT
jgi:hypothetical protein